MPTKISRRVAINTLASTAAVLSAASSLSSRLRAAENATSGLKGKINHSVCKWCYPKIALEEMCIAGKEIGLQSVELLTVNDFPTLQKHGLICAMVSGVPGGIESGFNRLENHDKLVEYFERTSP